MYLDLLHIVVYLSRVIIRESRSMNNNLYFHNLYECEGYEINLGSKLFYTTAFNLNFFHTSLFCLVCWLHWNKANQISVLSISDQEMNYDDKSLLKLNLISILFLFDCLLRTNHSSFDLFDRSITIFSLNHFDSKHDMVIMAWGLIVFSIILGIYVSISFFVLDSIMQSPIYTKYFIWNLLPYVCKYMVILSQYT